MGLLAQSQTSSAPSDNIFLFLATPRAELYSFVGLTVEKHNVAQVQVAVTETHTLALSSAQIHDFAQLVQVAMAGDMDGLDIFGLDQTQLSARREHGESWKHVVILRKEQDVYAECRHVSGRTHLCKLFQLLFVVVNNPLYHIIASLDIADDRGSAMVLFHPVNDLAIVWTMASPRWNGDRH